MNHNSTLLLTLTLENSLVIESLCYTTLHTPINLSWSSLCWWNPSAMPSVMAHSFSAEKFSLTSSNDSKELCISLPHLTLAQTEKLLFPQNPVGLLQKKYTLKYKILAYLFHTTLLWLATQCFTRFIIAKDQLSWEISRLDKDSCWFPCKIICTLKSLPGYYTPSIFNLYRDIYFWPIFSSWPHVNTTKPNLLKH